jgi:hypothetical protein
LMSREELNKYKRYSKTLSSRKEEPNRLTIQLVSTMSRLSLVT